MLGRVNCKICKKVIAINKGKELCPLPHTKVESISLKEITIVCKCGHKNIVKLNKQELEV